MRLTELHHHGDVFHETKYTYLYHLTDYHGFSYSVDQDALRSLRQHYISTTYDPDKNGVYGYSHYDFKFVLNGKALVAEYGGFNYDHHIMVGDSRKAESLNEREIGIDTREIAPLRNYLLGVQLLFPIFSQRAIQWLLYDNNERKSGIGAAVSYAPRTIETLHKVMVEWKKPVWVYDDGPRKLTPQESNFLHDVLGLHKSGADFAEGMRELAEHYPIKDHWQKDLDRTTVERRQKSKIIVAALNKYYQNRPVKKINVEVVKNIIRKSLDVLGLGNNITSVIMGSLEQAGLFHQLMAPVDWGIILKHLMDGDVDGALEAIEWVANEKSRLMSRFDQRPEEFEHSRHAGTLF